MLINQCDIKVQRFQDSLYFNYDYHCTQAHAILSENCIHLPKKNTIIFLADEDIDKIEALKPLINNCSTEQIINISKTYNKPHTSFFEGLNNRFNKKFGWFFKNGMK